VNGFGEKQKMKTRIQMHGCGYGDDGPVLTPKSQADHLRGLRIEKGNAFVWKPIAMTADERIQFAWGGPVLVTGKGATALFTRAHGMVSII
jgi:hypothetical protein